MPKLRTKSEMYVMEGKKKFYLSPRGTKYLINNNNKHRGQSYLDPILERLDYPAPPTLQSLGHSNLEDFKQFLAIEASKITQHSKDVCYKYFSKKSEKLDELGKLWMKNRDVSIYGLTDYLFETIHCSLFVTGEFKKSGVLGKNSGIDNLLRTLHHLDFYDKSPVIADLGAGLGLTTLFMAKVLPKADIYYVDASSASAVVLKKLMRLANVTNIKFVDSVKECPKVIDVVVAYEFVEHIESQSNPGVGVPLEAIDDWLIRIPDGGHFLYSTMWNAEQNNGSTIGHFTKYNFDGTIVELPEGKSDKRSRAPHKTFVKCMNNRGFKVRNGGGKRTEWDWKNHYPYCFTKI